MRRNFFAVTMIIVGSCMAWSQTSPKQNLLLQPGKTSAPAQCLGEQLSASRISDDAGAGQRGVNYGFTNKSAKPCTLTGVPRLVLLDRRGRRVRGVHVSYADASYFQPGESAEIVTLDPGKSGWFEITFSACQDPGKCPASYKVGITAPGTKRVFVLKERIDAWAGKVFVAPVRSGVPD
jgi:hypothetical protein